MYINDTKKQNIPLVTKKRRFTGIRGKFFCWAKLLRLHFETEYYLVLYIVKLLILFTLLISQTQLEMCKFCTYSRKCLLYIFCYSKKFLQENTDEIL
jgi:hypothetical protein